MPVIPYKNRSETGIIKTEDICYIERDYDYRRLHVFCDGREGVTIRIKTDELRGYLDNDFVWLTRSLIVNLRRVERVSKQYVYFENGSIYLTYKQYLKLKKYYEKFLAKNYAI